jgi:autophagy-related protein 13
MSGSSLTGALFDEQQKSDQIALHVYTKLFHVVYEARALVEGVGDRERERERERERDRERDNRERDRDRDRKPKIDRWFNLETPDSDFFPRELRETYKTISATGSPAPLFIHVLLSVPKSNSSAGAGNGNVLVALAQANTPGTDARIRIQPTPRYVLLEKWELKFIPRSSLDHPPSSPIRQQGSSGQGADGAVALPTIYKHGIPLFRSLYSLLRILPVWKLYKRLRRRTTGPSSSQLSIQLRLSDRDQVDGEDGDALLFGMCYDALSMAMLTEYVDMPPSPTHPPLPTQTQEFPPIPHPLGSFKLSTTYLESPTFQLDDLESLLSSRFLNEGFVPTLTSKPRSAAGTTSSSIASQAESIAEKFVIPPQPSPLSPGGVGASLKTGGGSGAGSSSSPPPPGHGHFSHLRQPSHPQSQHSQQQQHRADNSIPAGGGGGRSVSPTTLPVLSRLRLESSPGRRTGSLPSPSSPIAPASAGLPVPIPLTTPSPTVAGPVPVPAPVSGLGLALGPAQHSVQGISFPQAHSLPTPPQLPSTTLLQPQSPLPQSSSSSIQSGSQALPIRRLSTINPFKANTLLGGGTGGGSPAPGSGSGSGPGLGLLLAQGQGQGPAHGAPGTSSGSVHSIHSVHSPRHANSPLGLGAVGGESSLSSPHSSALSHSQLQQQYHLPQQQPPQPLQPFPTTQHSPQPPYSPPPQSGSLGLGLGPVFGSGSSSSLGSGFPHSPSPPGQGQQSPSTPTVPMLGRPEQRKRYSSSFSHRYTASGSVGSAVGVVGTSTGSTSPVSASPALGSPLTGLGAREGQGSPSPGFVEDVGKPRSRVRLFCFLSFVRRVLGADLGLL